MSQKFEDDDDLIGSPLETVEKEVIELFLKALSSRGPIPLQNLTGFLSQLRSTQGGVLNKSQLKQILHRHPDLFSISEKEVVQLRNPPYCKGSSKSRNEGGKSRESGQSSRRSWAQMCGESKVQNVSQKASARAVVAPQFLSAKNDSLSSSVSRCVGVQKVSQKANAQAVFAPQFLSAKNDSLSSSVSSIASVETENPRRIAGVVIEVFPSFGFIRADRKHHLKSIVFFGKETFRDNQEMKRSLKDVVDVNQRVVADIIPSMKVKSTAKYSAVNVWFESNSINRVASNCTSVSSDSGDSIWAIPHAKSRSSSVHSETLASLELNRIRGGRGVIQNLFNGFGFIKQGDSRNPCGNVYFKFSTVKNVPPGKKTTDLLELGLAVTFDAVPTEKKDSKAKWSAVHVWLPDMKNMSSTLGAYNEYDSDDMYMCRSGSSDDEDWSNVREPVARAKLQSSHEKLAPKGISWCECDKLINKDGKIYPLSHSEAKILFGQNPQEEALAISKVIYSGQNEVTDLMWEVDDGCNVTFSAIRDVDCPAGFLWKATIVSLGKKPLVQASAASSEKLWNDLMPHYRNTPLVKEKTKTEPSLAPSDDPCDSSLSVISNELSRSLSAQNVRSGRSSVSFDQASSAITCMSDEQPFSNEHNGDGTVDSDSYLCSQLKTYFEAHSQMTTVSANGNVTEKTKQSGTSDELEVPSKKNRRRRNRSWTVAVEKESLERMKNTYSYDLYQDSGCLEASLSLGKLNKCQEDGSDENEYQDALGFRGCEDKAHKQEEHRDEEEELDDFIRSATIMKVSTDHPAETLNFEAAAGDDLSDVIDDVDFTQVVSGGSTEDDDQDQEEEDQGEEDVEKYDHDDVKKPASVQKLSDGSVDESDLAAFNGGDSVNVCGRDDLASDVRVNKSVSHTGKESGDQQSLPVEKYTASSVCPKKDVSKDTWPLKANEMMAVLTKDLLRARLLPRLTKTIAEQSPTCSPSQLAELIVEDSYKVFEALPLEFSEHMPSLRQKGVNIKGRWLKASVINPHLIICDKSVQTDEISSSQTSSCVVQVSHCTQTLSTGPVMSQIFIESS